MSNRFWRKASTPKLTMSPPRIWYDLAPFAAREIMPRPLIRVKTELANMLGKVAVQRRSAPMVPRSYPSLISLTDLSGPKPIRELHRQRCQ